jgi:hypothetical protein
MSTLMDALTVSEFLSALGGICGAPALDAVQVGEGRAAGQGA